MQFSVIIPTLQRASGTAGLIRDLTASPYVGEILVINNADRPLPYDSPKLRELRQSTNIFVNPAWNLGAREAAHENLCFANDDIRFDSSFLGVAQGALRLPIGILSPHEGAFAAPIATEDPPARRERVRFSPLYRRTNGFGTLMLMDRRSFVPIPETLKVWFGDDFLFHQQRHRNVAFRGVPIHTAMSSTSGASEFVSMGTSELQEFRQIPLGDYDHRFRRDLLVGRPLVKLAKALRQPRRSD